MSSAMMLFDRELDRAQSLNRRLAPKLQEFLTDDYQAVVLHSSGTLFAMCAASEELFGYTPDEALYQNVLMFCPVASNKVIIERMQKKLIDPYVVAARHKNGHEFRVELKPEEHEFEGEHVRSVQIRLAD